MSHYKGKEKSKWKRGATKEYSALPLDQFESQSRGDGGKGRGGSGGGGGEGEGGARQLLLKINMTIYGNGIDQRINIQIKLKVQMKTCVSCILLHQMPQSVQNQLKSAPTMLLNLVCSELSSCSIVLHIFHVMTIDNFFFFFYFWNWRKEPAQTRLIQINIRPKLFWYVFNTLILASKIYDMMNHIMLFLQHK